MVLDRNPDNHFAEVEQAAFSPANLVPGIGLSPDKMLMGRVFSYHDTHLHRIGANYEQLPINAPRSPVHSYNKDGAMRFRGAGSQPVYAPNSLRRSEGRPRRSATGMVGRGRRDRRATSTSRIATTTTSCQAGALYRDVMEVTDREHLVTNIVAHASDGVSDAVQQRVVDYWSKVDAELGARVAAGLGHALPVLD